MSTVTRTPKPSTATLGVLLGRREEIVSIVSHVRKIPRITNTRFWGNFGDFWTDPRGREVDLLLLEHRPPEVNGLALTSRIARRDPSTRILILSEAFDNDLMLQALKSGAIGCLRNPDAEGIEAAVRTALGESTVLPPEIAARLRDGLKQGDGGEETDLIREARLSPRETEVMGLIVQGKTIAEVATDLSSSPNTVHHHTKSIYRKLNVHNRMQLARKAVAAGLL